MSLLTQPAIANLVAKTLQRLSGLATPNIARAEKKPGSTLGRFPEHPRTIRRLTIPTSVAPAPAVVYLPPGNLTAPPVHVNFHGGGFVMGLVDMEDPLCRFLAAEAGVVVINVDYVLAPQHPFPEPPRQAFDVIRWVADHGPEQGWDGDRLTIGGQSAGGSLAAAAARQALETGGPAIGLQVLHYPPLDLATPGRGKKSVIDKPRLTPWMSDVFDTAYAPDVATRSDRLISPANPADTSDLTGIAPALVITTEYDILRAEGQRYADRLRQVGALVEHYDVPGVDHGYDLTGPDSGPEFEKTRNTYELIARHVKQATVSVPPTTG